MLRVIGVLRHIKKLTTKLNYWESGVTIQRINRSYPSSHGYISGNLDVDNGTRTQVCGGMLLGASKRPLLPSHPIMPLQPILLSHPTMPLQPLLPSHSTMPLQPLLSSHPTMPLRPLLLSHRPGLSIYRMI